ncbi:Putative transmembrane protein (Alph_Pro_TM) [Roseovarius gaetbuli]|uniref:Putative transmembrane protein (Alph_Pro_TM) n=1 Tax=Roseovarius gaetbuli TaxID=1356575 RepID=A0A1X6ZTG0_9RHOB|nr:TIGR02186 family protein [Roseovarius gaetbuli]SLN61098.1 Putative transmembrane protein (Alph_Pro_TM) [Roseovarius gaetbuli]
MLRLALALCLLAMPLQAEEVVLGLSSDKVAITATFEGSDILIFGAVKREVAIPETPLDVIITVAGPSVPVTVRRKDRRFGIWVNTEMVELDAAPSFYAVATTRPLDKVLSNTEDLRHRVSIGRAIRSVGAATMAEDAERFTDALIRIRRDKDAYQTREGAVAIDEQTLFRTSISLPANLTEGAYQTRIFLTREGRVVSEFDTTIDVRKVGLERWLYSLSREQPMLYGLMSLAIAIAAGWMASAAFQALRRG